MTPDDFQNGGGLLCARNHTAGVSEAGVIECFRPVQGRYVTVQNLAHPEARPHMTFDKCLQICEVQVYGEGELGSWTRPWVKMFLVGGAIQIHAQIIRKKCEI